MPNLAQRRKGHRRKETGGSLKLPAGVKLFDRGHPCHCVYQLRSGRVQLAGGRGAIVDYLSSGDFFGEKCLLGSRHGGLAAKSLSPVKLSAFRKGEILTRVQRDRRFAARLLTNLARRLDRYEQTIEDAVVERAERRLALLLWHFLPARPASGWARLRFSPSNSELARSIRSTRWRIAHFMGHFQRLGWLQRRPELWVLREGLREFLQKAANQGEGLQRTPTTPSLT